MRPRSASGRQSAAALVAGPLLALLSACASRAPEATGDLLISNVRILAMTGEEASAPSSVLVAGDRIAWIGPVGSEGRVAFARRVEGGGAFLIPGLVDMHVHVQDPRDLLAFLRHGVTTVVNLEGSPASLVLREKVRTGELPGPQVFTSGPILDGDPGRGGAHAPVGSAAAARAEVERQAAAGYDVVKVYDLIEREAFEAAIAAAHAAGKPVFGHIPKPIGLEGILGRQDVVAHGEEYYYTFFHDTDDRGRIAEAVRLTAGAGLAVIPNTGFVRTIIAQAEDLDAFLDRDEMRFVAPATLADWLPEINHYLGRPPEWLANLHRMYPFLHELTRELRHGGVPIFAGSDTGAIGGVPGASLLGEIAELVDSGLTPFEALAAATRVPGEWLERRLGAAPRGFIAAGARADLVLLDGDPLRDLATLGRARAVVVAGRWHEVAELDSELAASAPPARDLLAWYREVRGLAAGPGLAALEARLASAPSAVFAEKVVNALGYRALYGDRDAKRAVRFFELACRAFPASANVWDSLGEGLAAKGDVAGAIASYEKSLALDPGNDNARRRIERLR